MLLARCLWGLLAEAGSLAVSLLYGRMWILLEAGISDRNGACRGVLRKNRHFAGAPAMAGVQN